MIQFCIANILPILGIPMVILWLYLMVKIRLKTEEIMKYDLIDSCFYIVAGLCLGGTMIVFEIKDKIITAVICLIYVGIATLIRLHFFPKN